MARRSAQRTFADRVISGVNGARYRMTEPARLGLARRRHEAEYAIPRSTPLISVYVPTYNRAKLLIDRAVSSVLAQTYTHFELIIVGDHCTDDTEARVARIRDPRIRFYNLPKRRPRYPETVENHWFAGPVMAANRALELVRGQWIARIDDDDIWTEDHLEALYTHAHRGGYEFVSGAYVAERDGERKVVNAEDDVPRVGGTQTWLYRSYLRCFRYNIHCWRKSWNRVNDVDLQMRMWSAGVRMGFLDRVVAYVLPRPGEKTVGLDAYRRARQNQLAALRFIDP